MEKSIELLELIKETFACEEKNIREYSPLTLAFVGDSIYDLVIRTVVVERSNRPANDLHREAVKFVNARVQAQIIEALLEELTPEELAIYKRGKNAKSTNSAKNASVQEYRKATGFETLIGFLYLTGKTQRVMELIRHGLTRLDMYL